MRQYFVLTGPTGTGKSKLGIELAQDFQCPVFSVDSMQVYRKMDIGSAKPTQEELSKTLHELIDVVDPSEDFDVSKFLHLTEMAHDRHKGRLLGVGGTPFYLKALENGLSNFEILPNLDVILRKLEMENLRKMLERLDPIRSKAILPNDRFRLERAIAIILSTGKRASSFLDNPPPKRANLKLFALNCDREIMHKRLKMRIDLMFKQGLLEEAKDLYENHSLSKTAAAGVGYKELFQYFEGVWDLETAKEKILIGTRRLFKHQMTWLRKMDVHWIDVHPEQVEKAYPILKEHLQKHFESI